MENVSFPLNNREVCDEKLPIVTSIICVRFISCKIYFEIEYLKFENTPCFQRLPEANGRKDSLRSYIL